MWINCIFVIIVFHAILINEANTEKRQRRYLIFTPSTQWGEQAMGSFSNHKSSKVFVTVSVPLPHPDTLVSVAWFYEANYYNVANATYLQPLLGDVDIGSVRNQRSITDANHILTRRSVYYFIETMLKKHGYPSQPCLLRAICENASQFLHDGLLGDLLHFILTPSSSQEEDIEDCYYEAEYWGLEGYCDYYIDGCPENPLDNISIHVE